MELPASPRLIDFHSHYYDTSWYPSQLPQGPNIVARAWPLLTNIEAQLEAMDEAGIDAKVLSAPASVLVPPGQALPTDLMRRINDHFAELVTSDPKHFLALATIDAFHGDSAVREVERAVDSLGMSGICVDCAQGDRLLDAAEARPVLERAASLDLAVFVHPVSPAGLTERLSRLGHTGILLARGTENAARILAILRSGILDELPNLRIVIPMIGAAAFLFAGMADQEYRREDGWRGTLPSVVRQRLYVDTMGFDPATIRFAIELLGTEHVLYGSDWPIMPIMSRQRVKKIWSAVGLTADQQTAIMGENTLRLLARHTEAQK